MFCPNCGKQIADGSVFCAECGAQLAAPAAPAQPAAPVQPTVDYSQPVAYASVEQSPVVRDTLAFLKGFFSPKMEESTGLAVRNTGIQWVIFAVINILMLSLSEALCFLYVAKQFMVGAFFIRMLVYAITFFALAGGVYVMTQVAFKKVVPFPAMLNLVAYATIPMTIAAIVNMILGLIPYAPITELVTATAVIMSLLLIFSEVKKLAPTPNTSVVPFVITVAVVILLYLILGDLLGRIVQMPGSLSSLASMTRTVLSLA